MPEGKGDAVLPSRANRSPFTVQQSKHFSYALFPPPVAHGSILTQPVETRWADSAPYPSP